MPYATTAARLLLAAALLNLTFLTGCASAGGASGGTNLGNERDAPTERPLPRLTPDQRAYIRELRAKPPEDLTAREIAYLEMIASQRHAAIAEEQADDVSTIKTLMVVSFALGLASSVVGVLVASSASGDADDGTGSRGDVSGY